MLNKLIVYKVTCVLDHYRAHDDHESLMVVSVKTLHNAQISQSSIALLVLVNDYTFYAPDHIQVL